MPGESDLERHGHLAFHLFRRGTGELCEDFDDRRGGIGVGLNVDIDERIDPDRRKGNGHEDDDERIIERPRDQFANHEPVSILEFSKRSSGCRTVNGDAISGRVRGGRAVYFASAALFCG